MNQVAGLYLLPPLPLVLLLALAVLWLSSRLSRRHRTGARLCAVFAVAAVVCSLPAVSKGLAWPLRALVRDWQEEGRPAVGAVVVPTGGSFADPIGGRWPSRATVRRAALGASLAAQHGLPLAISGGSPEELPFSEAGLVVDLLDLDRAGVHLDLTARNTHQNAAAFARLLHPLSVRTVLLVTDRIHMPRMAASLRAAGFQVYGHALGLDIDRPIASGDFLPSNRGLGYLAQVGAGYGGLVYYLIRGRFALRDLIDGTDKAPA